MYSLSILISNLFFHQDIAGTLATEEAEDSAQVAKLRSALESVDHKRRKVVILVQETIFHLLFSLFYASICLVKFT